jgi:hypothetical protein
MLSIFCLSFYTPPSCLSPRLRDHLTFALLDRFGELGGVDLDVPARSNPVRAAELPE